MAGRKAQVRYWTRKGGGYFTTRQGQQVELALGADDFPDGPVYSKALAAFNDLDRLDRDKGSNAYLVSALMEQYRTHLKGMRKTYPGMFDTLTTGFVARFGKLKVSDLMPLDVEHFLKSQKQWNDTSIDTAASFIKAALSFALRKKLILTNPLPKGSLDLARPRIRGTDARMSQELMGVLLDATSEGRKKTDCFRLFLLALRDTGARPIEIRMASTEHYRDGMITYRHNETKGYIHKTARKTQRDRVIHLSPVLRDHVENRIAMMEGRRVPLFCTPRGKHWSQQNLENSWLRLKERQAVKDYMAAKGLDMSELVLYNFRHSFISDWMDTVGDIYLCAKFTGTSPAMIATRYGHPKDETLIARFAEFQKMRK